MTGIGRHRRWLASALAATAAAALATGGTHSAVAAEPVPYETGSADGSAPNWPLVYFDAEQVWEVSRGEGVVVGLVDSNVAVDHPDLTGVVTAQQYFDPRYEAGGWHGTKMASLIAGTGDQLIVGLAPDAELVVAGMGEMYPAIDVDAAGIRWAVDQGAEVLNLSYSMGGVARPEQQAAIEYALAQDVVVVAAAGNTPQDTTIRAPALYPGVIAVSAIDGSSQFCRCSVTDPKVVVAAPGYEVIGASPVTTGYTGGSGTSSATALVSAVAALVRAEHPELDAANVVNRIIATARDAGSPGRDPQFGFGIIDPMQALTADVALVDTNPLLAGAGASASPSPSASGSAEAPTDGPQPSPTGSWGGGEVDDGVGGGSFGSADDEGSGAASMVTMVLTGAGVLVLVGAGAAVLVIRRRRGDPPVGDDLGSTAPTS